MNKKLFIIISVMLILFTIAGVIKIDIINRRRVGKYEQKERWAKEELRLRYQPWISPHGENGVIYAGNRGRKR